MLDTLPGSPPLPPPLAEALGRAVAARGPGFVPRTRHRQGAAPRFTNRLALESSPYLLQHAHNPVDWRPWGDEAFAEARASHRPVFLSVGYSTCHWCHVMEEESFEDLEIAAYLNQHYVCIKVDREERPDVDAVYMTAVQALSGSGGWPMSVWLNGDREPFFGGTYFPPRDGDRGAPVGFLSALRQVEGLWRTDRLRISRAAGTLAEAVRTALSHAGEPAPGVPALAAVDAAVRGYVQRFDDQHGGLVGAPKFPSSLPVRLLLRHHRRTGDAASLHMAVHTLERMAAGGLHDQLAGGFHRYSTDARWLVPHFEKMLYDNALLALAYAEAWQATGRADFARVLRSTLDWMLREMALPEGGLASATDADSEGEEGRFFAWTAEEVAARLGPEAARFCAFHGVTAEGNFEGRNVLHVPRPDEAEWQALAPAREKLRRAREERPHPLRDDKVLAAWNGLALSALAVGGRALGEPRYVAGAERIAGFLLGALRPEGRLHRSWNAARLGPPAFLEDHAFLCRGLLDLHEGTLDPRWLAEARAIAEELERRFADPAGGWFVTPADGEQLLARQRPSHDGAEPSGASVAALAALRLAALTGEDRWRQVADGALRVHGETLARHPMALAEMLLALELRHAAVRELVLVWQGEEPPERLLAPLRRRFEPALVVTGAREGAPLEALARVTRLAGEKRALGGQPTAYLCRQGACGLPTADPAELVRQLDEP